MKFSRIVITIFSAVLAAAAVSCDDGKTYAELLDTETQSVNRYLADQMVVAEIPADTVFITGPDAPYYRLDEDGMLYMQVIDPGTKDNRAEDDELIYFRFTRYNLNNYADGKLPSGTGNETDMGYLNSSFRYNNYQLQSSIQWGTGVQTPLAYLPVDCEVNLIIKSQYGFSSEIANVIPFLYHLRYYRPKI